MRKIYLTFLLVSAFAFFSHAQNYWTGGANNGLWNDGLNWTSGVPLNTDDVVIDNLHGALGSFTVTLPGGVSATIINTLQITPIIGNTIILHLPATNTASPGFSIIGPGDCVILNEGGVLKNSSQAGVIPTIDIANTIRINNAGKYWHNSPRSATPIVDKLSLAAGTEYGIFEYDIPLAGSTAIGLSGKTFGSLSFSAAGQGMPKSYLASGGSDLIVRGDFSIYVNATLNLQLTSNTFIARHFDIIGTFNYNPASIGVTNRSILFNGTTSQNITGAGTFTLGANFRNMEVLANAKVFLQRDINLPVATHNFIINTDGSLYTGTNKLTGIGVFTQNPNGLLGIGSADGIILAPTLLGNIQTTTRNYNTAGKYEYDGAVAQVTGDGLPVSVGSLIINNSATETVTLTNAVTIDNEFNLQQGFLKTTNLAIPTLASTGSIASPNSNYAFAATNIGWEKSFVNGPMNYSINQMSKKWLPVGKLNNGDTLFAPVGLDKFNNTLATYTGEYFPEPHFDYLNILKPPLDHVSSLEYWDIDCNIIQNLDNNAKITLSWRPNSGVGNGNLPDDPQALADLNVAHYFDSGNGDQWQLEGMNPTFTANGVPAAYGLVNTNLFSGSFSPFTLGSKSAINILPVKFLKFTGQKGGKNIVLQWVTKEEQALSYYAVEKSTDGVHFTQIGKVTAKNGIAENTYGIIDDHANPSWNYYRLKIVTAQNSYTFSNTVKVNLAKNNPIVIYPNPVKDELMVRLPFAGSTSTINIVNTSGQVVKRVKSSNQNIIINVSALSNGAYFLTIENNQQKHIYKFAKQ